MANNICITYLEMKTLHVDALLITLQRFSVTTLSNVAKDLTRFSTVY